MIKRSLTFSAIQIVALVLSFLILVFALAGSHGRLYFSNVGGTVAVIMTIMLSLPSVYLFTQRNKLKNKKLLFTIAILLFCLAMTAIYIGVPNLTKQFIIDKSTINGTPIYSDNGLTINLTLEPEMFDRVGIEVNINKASDIEFRNFYLTTVNNKEDIVKPVFRPSAWDSLHSETIQMNSFFEINDYSKMNRFSLSGQYSIEDTDSLKIQVDFTFSKNGQTISSNKQFGVRIVNQLKLEKLIKY